MKSPLSDQKELVLQGRYLLKDKRREYRWGHGATESWWVAHDRQAWSAMDKAICEVSIPERGSVLQPAMKSLMMISSQHPEIIQLLDVFQERGRNYFVFQQVRGESLHQQIRRMTCLPEEAMMACCRDILPQFTILAKAPLVHGLISPDHIVETPEGKWRLIDFSVLVASGVESYRVGVDHATLSPFSPLECAQGIFSAQTDLSAFLACVYYGLTGHVPGAGRTLPPIRTLNPTVSQRFSDVLVRGLQPTQEARLHSCEELCDALGVHMAGERASSRRSLPRASEQVPSTIRSASLSQAARPAHISLPFSTSGQRTAPMPEVPVRGREPANREEQAVSHRPRQKDDALAALVSCTWVVGLLIVLLTIIVFAR